MTSNVKVNYPSMMYISSSWQCPRFVTICNEAF